MGKWCLYASLFIFDWIIIKVAGNQDRHKSLVEFDFGPNQTTHFGVTCPWVTKISHFWTWISLRPVGQSWSNFMCSITGGGERLHKVLGQIDLGTLDSGERSLPFGLLVYVWWYNIGAAVWSSEFFLCAVSMLTYNDGTAVWSSEFFPCVVSLLTYNDGTAVWSTEFFCVLFQC